MEAGKDEYVQDIATLYVTNASDEYLEYANVKCAVNGQEALFVVAGLKPGTSAWGYISPSVRGRLFAVVIRNFIKLYKF